MMPVLVVSLYSMLIVTGSLLGGMIPSRFRISHLGMQIILSFVGGLMLGIGLLHLLPHSLQHQMHPGKFKKTQIVSLDESIAGETPTEVKSDKTVELYARQVSVAITTTFASAMVGLLGMFFLIRLFHFHQHGPISDASDVECDHDHGHGHHKLSWGGVAFGLSVHSLLDGVALGSAVLADASHTESGTGLSGLGVFLAIALHKPLDALSITTLMQTSGWTRRSQQAVNAGFAAMCPIGALLVMLAGNIAFVDANMDMLIGIALGLSGGVFLCISLSDLLPEVQFHHHDRLKLSGALVLGVTCAYALRFIERSPF